MSESYWEEVAESLSRAGSSVSRWAEMLLARNVTLKESTGDEHPLARLVHEDPAVAKLLRLRQAWSEAGREALGARQRTAAAARRVAAALESGEEPSPHEEAERQAMADAARFGRRVEILGELMPKAEAQAKAALPGVLERAASTLRTKRMLDDHEKKWGAPGWGGNGGTG